MLTCIDQYPSLPNLNHYNSMSFHVSSQSHSSLLLCFELSLPSDFGEKQVAVLAVQVETYPGYAKRIAYLSFAFVYNFLSSASFVISFGIHESFSCWVIRKCLAPRFRQHGVQVEVEDFVKRAKAFTKEIEAPRPEGWRLQVMRCADASHGWKMESTLMNCWTVDTC